jgi:hypothetical protein
VKKPRPLRRLRAQRTVSKHGGRRRKVVPRQLKNNDELNFNVLQVQVSEIIQYRYSQVECRVGGHRVGCFKPVSYFFEHQQKKDKTTP